MAWHTTVDSHFAATTWTCRTVRHASGCSSIEDSQWCRNGTLSCRHKKGQCSWGRDLARSWRIRPKWQSFSFYYFDCSIWTSTCCCFWCCCFCLFGLFCSFDSLFWRIGHRCRFQSSGSKIWTQAQIGARWPWTSSSRWACSFQGILHPFR